MTMRKTNWRKIWMEAENRSEISEAANRFDRELANDAVQKGHEVEGGLLEILVPPLSFLYVVSEPDRMVRVLDVVRF